MVQDSIIEKRRIGTAALSVEGLAGGYSDTPIIEDIDLVLKRGAWAGIVGPNGCGKTTLLRMLSRTLKPLKGSVILNGEDIYLTPHKLVAKKIAIVPQSINLEFNFTVAQFVAMGRLPYQGRFTKESKMDRKFARFSIERVGSGHLEKRTVTELSGGEMQKVLIAQALAQDPEILLLDEPTRNLDLNHQLEIMDLISRLKGEGLAVVSVLHDLNLAAYYCDEILMMKKGRIEISGKPLEILNSQSVLKIFGVDTVVHKHPVTGKLSVTTLPRLKLYGEPDGRSVHVICGSGSGLPVINALRERGFDVSIGVVNALDSDYQFAQNLGLTVVAEAPFSNISDDKFLENIELASESSSLVIAPMPIGPANLANLEAAVEVLRRGIPVIFLENTPIEERDFTGGKAKAVRSALIDAGAKVVCSEEELLCELQALRLTEEGGACG